MNDKPMVPSADETLEQTMDQAGIPRENYTVESVPDARRAGRPIGRIAALAKAALIADPEERRIAHEAAAALPVATAWTADRIKLLAVSAEIQSRVSAFTYEWAAREVETVRREYLEECAKFGPNAAGALFAFQVLKIWVKEHEKARRAWRASLAKLGIHKEPQRASTKTAQGLENDLGL